MSNGARFALKGLAMSFLTSRPGAWLNSGICPNCLARDRVLRLRGAVVCAGCGRYWRVFRLGSWIVAARAAPIIEAGDGDG
jgi:hypothetical protein